MTKMEILNAARQQVIDRLITGELTSEVENTAANTYALETSVTLDDGTTQDVWVECKFTAKDFKGTDTREPFDAVSTAVEYAEECQRKATEAAEKAAKKAAEDAKKKAKKAAKVEAEGGEG